MIRRFLPRPLRSLGRPSRSAWDAGGRPPSREAYDVIVIGGGLRALAIARACARGGAAVALFAPGEIAGAVEERAWPVVRAGHVDGLRMAAHAGGPERVAKLGRRLDTAFDLDRTGCLTLAASSAETDALIAAAARAKAIGVDAWMVPPREVAALSPPLSLGGGLAPALYEAGALTVDVDALAFALAHDAAAAGAELFPATPVEALARDGAAVVGVRIAGAAPRADAVVLSDDAAGVRLVREGKGRLSLKREERLSLRTEAGAPSIGPALVVGDVTLARDQSGAVVASGPADPDGLALKLVTLAPGLAGLAVTSEEPMTIWTGVDGRSQVGQAEIPGLWLALGFGREATSAALPAAKHVATLLAGRPSNPAFEPYAPMRRSPAREQEVVR